MARRPTYTPPRTDMRAPLDTSGEDSDICRRALDAYGRDLTADQHNAEPARQDMQFVVGDQWDIDVKNRRTKARKPVLTINRLPAFVAQYVGSWLQSDTTIKLSPARGGTKKIAEIRQGLLRTITRTQDAKNALNRAMSNAYICGIGNFKVALKDAVNDVFLRDITFETIDDPLGVVWDRASKEPTGADAKHCFVPFYMTREDFKEAYPDANPDGGWVSDELDHSIMVGHGWETDDMLRVCEFWQMRHEPVVLGLEPETGDVIDLTDVDPTLRAGMVAPDQNGDPMIRETVRPYAECYVLTSTQVLEGPYRLDIPRLPVFRVEGWSIVQANVKFRWGFVRNAKDPQRLHNYWRSVLAEELQKSVSTKWLYDIAGGKGQFLDQFRTAHLSNDNVLQWDSSSGGVAPQQIPAPPMNQAVLTEAGMSVQDMKDVTNKHEASLGIQSNEVSGRAITARQRVSELGDIIYIENMNAALAEAGRVINDLIPVVYDTNRTVKVTGVDDQETLQEINGTAGDATPDVTQGKYGITYSTGPSYASKRQEAVDVTMTLMNTMPQVGNVVADILVRNMDIPGAEEIEERLASMLPPGMVNPERLPAARREAVAQQQQAAQQQAQQQQQLQMMQFQAAMAKLAAEVAELNARAQRQTAQAQDVAAQREIDRGKLDLDAMRVQIDAFEAGMQQSKMGLDAIKLGLEAADKSTDRDERREAAQNQQQETPE